jgi:hypothetical protein
MQPRPARPYMPGYGILAQGEGTGLLSWVEVEPRIASSHDYWLASTWPDGRPHVMPVWGVWERCALWLSSSRRSRKIANLLQDERCVATIDNPRDPIVIEGLAEVITAEAQIYHFLKSLNAKYRTAYALDFLDPAINATVRIVPRIVFALLQEDFCGSPTRWTFEGIPP